MKLYYFFHKIVYILIFFGKYFNDYNGFVKQQPRLPARVAVHMDF